MEKVIPKNWYSLNDACQIINHRIPDVSLSPNELIELAIEKMISLSFRFFGDIIAEAGELVALEEAKVNLCFTERQYEFCDLETRQVLYSANTKVIDSSDLSDAVQRVGREILFGKELNDADQAILQRAMEMHRPKEMQKCSMEFRLAGNRIKTSRFDKVYEPTFKKTIIGRSTWEIMPIGIGRLFLDQVLFKFYSDASHRLDQVHLFESQIRSVGGEETPLPSGYFYLLASDQKHCIALTPSSMPEHTLIGIDHRNLSKVLERLPVAFGEPAENEIKREGDNALSTTERNTLYKMILGMAIKKYGYNPESRRNAATGENTGSICADLEKAGLSVDSDTIRDHLKAAYAAAPPEKS